MKRRLKWFWQRLTRGWDDREVWNLDHTFAEWIVPRLELLKKTKHGIPQSCFPNRDFDYIEDEFSFANLAWEKVMDDMIAGFRRKAHSDGDVEFGKDAYDRAKGLFAKHLDDLWD